MDSLDKNKIHPAIELHPEKETKFKRVDGSNDSLASVVGRFIVTKGMKQSWSFKMDYSYIMLGIMDDEIIKSKDTITDFTDTTHKGYGLESHSWSVYHDDDKYRSGCLMDYVEQFDVNDTLLITMELDMTQKVNQNGILKYIIHNEPEKDVTEIRTDDQFTNIAFDIITLKKISICVCFWYT